MSDEEIELNLLDPALRAVGLVLMAITMAVAAFLAGWVLWQRRSPVVKAMQPVFLIMLCFGAFLTNLGIVPLGIDDVNNPNADAACMAYPWFLALGSTFILSALFSKLWCVRKTQDFAVLPSYQPSGDRKLIRM